MKKDKTGVQLDLGHTSTDDFITEKYVLPLLRDEKMRNKLIEEHRACPVGKAPQPHKGQPMVEHSKELQNIDGHKCPVIMLTGTYDYLTPPEATENTARQIKGGVYIEMADIGHFPMSENHEVFRVYLMEALKIIQERTSK